MKVLGHKCLTDHYIKEKDNNNKLQVMMDKGFLIILQLLTYVIK